MPVSTDWTNPYPVISRMAGPGGSLNVTISATSRTANISAINISNTCTVAWRFRVQLGENGTPQPFEIPAGLADSFPASQLRQVFGRNINYSEVYWSMDGVG